MLGTETMSEVAISVLTLITVWMAGDKNKKAPAMGIIAEAGWFIWIISYQHWGLLVLNLSLIVLYIRMHFKWK